MQRDIILKNRLAAKLFGYFLLLVFLPVLAFSFVANWQTNRHMDQTHRQYLLRAAEMLNQLYLNRLIQLGESLQTLRLDTTTIQVSAAQHPYFSTVMLMEKGDLSSKELDHITAGRPLLRGEQKHDPLLEIIGSNNGRIIRGIIRPEALWGVSEELPLPRNTALLILDQVGHMLFQSAAEPITLPETAQKNILSSIQGQTSFIQQGIPQTAFFRELFLESRVLFPRWTLVLYQPTTTLLNDQTMFMALFPLIVALCLGLVLYLILVLIRRNLEPLSILQGITRRIARKDFDARADIHTGDEIEELGQAFNSMTAQLKQQFNTLETQAHIDREILSSVDVDAVIATAMNYLHATFTPDSITLVFREKDHLRSYTSTRPGQRTTHTHLIPAAECERICQSMKNTGWMRGDEMPELLTALQPTTHSRLACAIPLTGMPLGILYMDFSGQLPTDQETLDFSGRTLNQIAVALANIRLLRELQEFNWGTLEALALAVDEKSPWTSGHSNRVAALAIDLATALDWSEQELEILHRAALLHDLGKIGISTDILDKPGRLTNDEYEIIQTHPDRGAKILEPIPAFAQIIPLVRHHHERYDGSGYPSGLAGKDSPQGARLLAIVDVYDAVTSDRPYREGWSHQKACDYLQENAGTLFDPELVQAFVAMR